MVVAMEVVGVATASGTDISGLLPGGVPVPAARTPATLDETGQARARALAAYWGGLERERVDDRAGARVRFMESLRLDPGHGRLAAKLAAWHAEAGEWDEGLAVLTGVVVAAPTRPEGLLILSDFCLRHLAERAGWRERAVTAAEEAVAKFPAVAEVQAHLIRVHLRLNESEAAQAVLKQALTRDERDPRYWLGLTGSAMAVWPPGEGDHRERILAIFQRAQALAPDDPSVTGAMADFLALHGGVAEASQLYEAIVKRRPDNLRAREKLARTLALTDRRGEAVEAWREVLRIDPQHETAHRALARHFSQSGDRVASVRHRVEALRWGRGETLGEALSLAREMLQEGLSRDALPVLERAEFNVPTSPEAPYLAALAHQAAGDLPSALAAYARAAAVASGDERVAASFFTDGFHFDWAVAASLAGQVEVAEAKFREAIARVPARSPELAAKSYNGLAYLWLENDVRLDEAGPLIERALKLDPGNPAYLDTRGWHHFKKGKFQEAADVLLQAEAASPRPSAEIGDHRAQALWALGQHAEAIKVLEKSTGLPEATEAMKQRLAAWRASRP